MPVAQFTAQMSLAIKITLISFEENNMPADSPEVYDD
jgi:hypothetical protein